MSLLTLFAAITCCRLRFILRLSQTRYDGESAYRLATETGPGVGLDRIAAESKTAGVAVLVLLERRGDAAQGAPI
jgi:hypothetical protein